MAKGIKIDHIPDIIQLYPPATKAELAALTAAFPGLGLPKDYLELLGKANGWEANLITLFASAAVPERNETYEVQQYAPGYCYIGDADGRALVIRTDSSASPVSVVDHGSMAPEDMIEIGKSLRAWIEGGCPLP